MVAFLRLLSLSLLLAFALPAAADEKISKGDLDAHKELLLLKIDSQRELTQKEVDILKSRIDAFEKRIDDQNNRVSDIGQSVDRLSLTVSLLGLVLTVLLASTGLVGYFSVVRKSREEARTAAEKWFDDNHQELADRIQGLETAAKQAHQKIVDSVSDVERHSDAAVMHIQKGLNAPSEKVQEISTAEEQALRQSAEQLKEKPEASYSFDDWNTRAFDAYSSGQYEDAALYWKHASNTPNAGAAKTAQALSNRSAVLYELKMYDEAIAGYEKVVDKYSSERHPAIRVQVARAMNNLAVALGKANKLTEELATYEKLIATYSSDRTAAVREQVARAMNNLGVALGNVQKRSESIATYEKVIATYASDNTPEVREPVATAMFNLGVALGHLGQRIDEIAAYQKLIAAYSSDDTPEIRKLVATALNGKGFAQLMEAKKVWTEGNKALALLHNARDDLNSSLNMLPDDGMMLGNLAYVQWLLGNMQEAEERFRAALAAPHNGGNKLYQDTLKDISEHAIPEDGAFQNMVERLWDESQVKTSREL